MLLLVDWEIHDLAKSGMVEPYDPKYLNPNSLDVTLGNILLTETDNGFNSRAYRHPYEYYDERNFWEERSWDTLDISKDSDYFPSWLYPGQFMLGHTEQVFCLPANITAQFNLKSSRAREGYGHALAGLCDAGWHDSTLTLELHNNSKTPLPLYPGLRIGQLVFFKLENTPNFDYSSTGRYNHDKIVQISKG